MKHSQKTSQFFSSYLNRGLLGTVLLSAVLLSALLFSIPSLASPWYIGGGVGLGMVDDFCEDVSSHGCDEDGTAFQIFGGVKVGKFVAFELTTGGITGMKAPRSRIPERDGYTDVSLIGLNALFFLPLSDQVKIFGGPGIYYTDTSTEIYKRYYYAGYVSVDDEYYYFYYDDDDDGYSDYDDNHITKSSTEGGLMLGIEVAISSKFSGRFQLQSIRSVDGGVAFDKDRDVNFFTANMVYNF